MSAENTAANTGKSTAKKGVLKWIYSVPGKARLIVVVLMVLQTISGSTGVFYALFMKDIVDSAVAGDKSGFVFSIIRIVVLILIQILLYILINHFSELARAKIENKFKGRLFENILRRDYSRVTAIHSGEWINRMTNDAVLLANGCVEVVPSLCGMVVRMISALVMIIIIDWRIAVIMVPAGLVLGLFAYSFRKKLKKLHKEVQEKDGSFRVFLQENISSLIMIRSFAAQAQALAEAEAKMTDHKNARMHKNRFSVLTGAGFSLAMNGMYFLGIFYGGWGILAGTISYGTLMAITQLISQLQGPIVSITGIIPRIFTLTASAERLMDIEEYEGESDKVLPSSGEISSFYENSFGAVGLKDAYFTYYSATEEMPRVLNGVSCEIHKGEYVAFTGHSGCGKSTVLKLLMSVYKLDSGMVYCVNNDGNVQEISGAAKYMFAYVPQGNLLMSGTIRDVVCFADKSRSNDSEAIRRALDIACASEFVYELDDGLDTILGERGTGLSEGQMQRLAIARAIFSERPVLLLDEATSALDEMTERRLLENLRAMTDMTVVIITHRPAALKICDRIFEFSESGIVEV